MSTPVLSCSIQLKADEDIFVNETNIGVLFGVYCSDGGEIISATLIHSDGQQCGYDHLIGIRTSSLMKYGYRLDRAYYRYDSTPSPKRIQELVADINNNVGSTPDPEVIVAVRDCSGQMFYENTGEEAVCIVRKVSDRSR